MWPTFFFVGFFLDDWCIRTATNIFDQLRTLDPEKSLKSGNPVLEKKRRKKRVQSLMIHFFMALWGRKNYSDVILVI